MYIPHIKKSDVCISLLLGWMVFRLLLPFSPIYRLVPFRDSGVFLYVGQQILAGQIPYRDVWDHKGPLIYYINAFGLSIDHGSRWGVWYLEFIFLYIAALLSYYLITTIYSRLPAIFGSVIFLLALSSLIDGGNLTEEYSLPLQFGILLLFWQISCQKRNLSLCFGLGILSAFLFLLRPNNAGIAFSVMGHFLLTGLISGQSRRALQKMAFVMFGVITVLIIPLIYFSWHHGLNDFLEAVFEFNRLYSKTTFAHQINSSLSAIEDLIPSGLFALAWIGWIVGIIDISSGPVASPSRSFLSLLLLNWPVEFVLSSLSGRFYAHYYMTWLPTLVLLAAFALFYLTKSVVKGHYRSSTRLAVCITSFLLATNISFVLNDSQELLQLVNRDVSNNQILTSIQAHLHENEYLLMWGSESVFNYLTRHPSPTRFVYQTPLYRCNYQTDEKIHELINAIKIKKPIIVDTYGTLQKAAPLDPNQKEQSIPAKRGCNHPTNMITVIEFINQNYEFVEVIEHNNWAIYRPLP